MGKKNKSNTSDIYQLDQVNKKHRTKSDKLKKRIEKKRNKKKSKRNSSRKKNLI